jgi:hypothetical protein
VKFVYKIHSGFDGFTPQRIPERMLEKNLLRLGWKRYLDVVDRGMEVWLYFRGPHRFDDGVYLMGTVSEIDFQQERVLLRVREYSTETPITDAATSQRLPDVVSIRYQQVFVLPEELDQAAPPSPRAKLVKPVECTVGDAAVSCAQKMCGRCATWDTFPLIRADDMWWPPNLSDEFEGFAAAYWVIPTRCYLSRYLLKPPVRQASELFYRFKVGEGPIAYPLSLGIYQALQRQGFAGDFDAVVPIPLSPDKAALGELHRAKGLAEEISEMLSVPLVEGLKLGESISKRRLLAEGGTRSSFAARYFRALSVSRRLKQSRRALLVDDVCTHGTTLSTALRRLRVEHPGLELVAATAGQMILKSVVRHDARLVAHAS